MITAIDPNTALVLIDLQKGIAKGSTAHSLRDVLNRAAFLGDAFRDAGLPVIVVHVNPEGAPWTRTRVESPAGPKDSILQQFVKAVLPDTTFTDTVPEIGEHQEDIIILKKTWNAFFGTNLHQVLQQMHITGIALAGISTSVGVEGTARAASELGYNISFATDAMTDRQLAAHQHSITNIFPRIGELGTTAEIVMKLPSSNNSYVRD